MFKENTASFSNAENKCLASGQISQADATIEYRQDEYASQTIKERIWDSIK